MKNKCAKCKKNKDRYTTVVKDGEFYEFCDVCFKVFNSFPGSITMDYFLKYKEDCPIYQARKERAYGNYKWI